MPAYRLPEKTVSRGLSKRSQFTTDKKITESLSVCVNVRFWREADIPVSALPTFSD